MVAPDDLYQMPPRLLQTVDRYKLAARAYARFAAISHDHAFLTRTIFFDHDAGAASAFTWAYRLEFCAKDAHVRLTERRRLKQRDLQLCTPSIIQ